MPTLKQFAIGTTVIAVFIAIGAYVTFGDERTAEVPDPEPAPCLVQQFTWQEVNDGYAVFTDYGAKSYIMLSTSEGIKIYEEEVADRSNCIEE